jgi:hypothetical protein
LIVNCAIKSAGTGYPTMWAIEAGLSLGTIADYEGE